MKVEKAKGIVEDVTIKQIKKCKHILDFPDDNILALIKANIPDEIYNSMKDQDIDAVIIKVVSEFKSK